MLHVKLRLVRTWQIGFTQIGQSARKRVELVDSLVKDSAKRQLVWPVMYAIKTIQPSSLNYVFTNYAQNGILKIGQYVHVVAVAGK